MGASILITLREGLEIALVLAVMIAYLVKTGRGGALRPVWAGTAAAAAVCIATGVAFHLAVGEFVGKTEQFIEGTLAFSAAAVLTWMIFWMRANSRNLGGELRGRIDTALGQSAWALGLVAFVAVAREGFETVLFLLGAEAGTSSGGEVILGGVIGLAIAAVIGLAFYRGSERVDLKRFFHVTGLLLILFAAGLFAKGVHEFREFLGIDASLIATPLWTITSGPFAQGWLHDFLQGLFGWSPEPERIRVVAYLAYLVPILWLYFLPSGSPSEKTTGEHGSEVADKLPA